MSEKIDLRIIQIANMMKDQAETADDIIKILTRFLDDIFMTYSKETFWTKTCHSKIFNFGKKY